jgi:hypothetical protein
VKKGDRIISVNTVSGCGKKMLEECKNNQLLRLTLIRGECPEEEGETTPKSSKLNPSVPAFEPVPNSSPGAAASSAAAANTPPTQNGAGFSFNVEAKAFIPP